VIKNPLVAWSRGTSSPIEGVLAEWWLALFTLGQEEEVDLVVDLGMEGRNSRLDSSEAL